MAGFGQASTIWKVILVLTLIAFILDLIGFATSYWQDLEYLDLRLMRVRLHSGLWEGCSQVSRGPTLCRSTVSYAGWFEATQAFETLGFIAALAALVLIVLYIFVPATSGKRIVFLLSMVACFVAAGCIILGIIIYGAKTKHDLSWSYALCTIAGIIFGVSGVLLLVDMMKR